MAEAVDVVADGAGDVEAVGEVGLGDMSLFDEAVFGGEVAVGLDVPTADDLPASLGDEVLDTGEEVGVGLLDDFVEPGVAAGEDEVGVFFKAADGGVGGGDGFVEAGGPLPAPDGVEVGVADHVDG